MKGAGIRDAIHQESFPTKWSVSAGSLQKQVVVDGPAKGSLRAEVVSFDDFLVSQLTFLTDEQTSCTCQGSGGTVGLYFNLAGSCRLSGQGHDCLITSGEHTIYYSADYVEKPQLLPENGEVRVLEINIPVSYYARLLAGYSTLQDKFLARIAANGYGQLHEDMLPITLPMKWIINTIQQNKRTGAMKRMFLKAKILELLMFQVEQAEVHERERGGVGADHVERDALYQAKAILEKNLADPPTIRHLAKMVGMNEFNLKKGFKETFRETIYGFVNKAKMQQAKEILLEGNRSIQEVALLVGYKNPQHFTAAFKKYYGVIPSKVTSGSTLTTATSSP